MNKFSPKLSSGSLNYIYKLISIMSKQHFDMGISTTDSTKHFVILEHFST